MSGPAIHHIVANKVAKKLTPQLDSRFATELTNGRFNPYLNLGCQGPDWLFFLKKDWESTALGTGASTLAETYLEIDLFLSDLKEKIVALIPPQLKTLVEELKVAEGKIEEHSSTFTEISNLVGKIRDTLSLLETDIIKFAEKYITNSFNVFDNLVTTAYHDVPNLKDWWWFDILHYRKTGEFALTLLKNSAPNSGARAFAMGYATHYACDTVGHPFVNTMVGGPFRTHSQRHKFVESHHDVWAWKALMNDEEFIKSSLGENHYIMEGDEDHLPQEVKDLILKSLKELYFDALNNRWLYGKEVTGDDLDKAYHLWRIYFENVTNVTDLPEPIPYSYSAEAEEIFNKFKSNITEIVSLSPGNMSLLSILEALAIAIISPILLALAAADFIIAELENLVTAPLNYLLSYLYENLYSSFKQLHYGLAINGLAWPFKDQLNTDISLHTTNSGIPDKFNHTAIGLIDHYPMKKFKRNGMENVSHLIYPFGGGQGNATENSTTNAAPFSYYNKTPEHYIQGNLKFDKDYFNYVSQFSPNLKSKERDGDFLEFKKKSQERSLGTAVEFSCALLEDFINNGENVNFPNFNLDGDRGYAFKGWRRVEDGRLIGLATGKALPETKLVSKHDLIDIPDEGVWPFKTRTEDKDVPNELTDIIQPNSNVL